MSHAIRVCFFMVGTTTTWILLVSLSCLTRYLLLMSGKCKFFIELYIYNPAKSHIEKKDVKSKVVANNLYGFDGM